MNRIRRGSFCALRGGHATADIREAFLECLDAPADEGWQPFGGKGRVLGRLWNCTDIVPGYYCNELGLQTGSTYAQAIRALKPRLRESGIQL